MAGQSPPKSLDEITRAALTDALVAIEDHHDADVLAIFEALYFTVEDRVRLGVETIAERHAGRRERLLVLLDTPGGSIETAERIVNVTRHFYPDHVAFLVPDRAMSAGTILAMSGDEIWMDYYSCLGPIDPQVETGGPEGPRLVPALAYLEQYKRMQDLAREGRLTQADALLLSKLDLAELRRFELERDRSIALIKDWLARYKFKNWTRTRTRGKTVTRGMRQRRAAQIARALQSLERWGSHGRGITMRVLVDELRLRIDDYGENRGLHDIVRTYFGLMREAVPQAASFVHTRTLFG